MRANNVSRALLTGAIAVGVLAGGGAATVASADQPQPTVMQGQGRKVKVGEDPAPLRSTAAPRNLGSYQVVSYSGTLAGREYVGFAAYCPGGMRILGGGSSQGTASDNFTFRDSYPLVLPDGRNGWVSWLRNDGFANIAVTVYAICGS